MAFREVSVVQIKEVLRLWLRGGGGDDHSSRRGGQADQVVVTGFR